MFNIIILEQYLNYFIYLKFNLFHFNDNFFIKCISYSTIIISFLLLFGFNFLAKAFIILHSLLFNWSLFLNFIYLASFHFS